jgi:hypothetical protein
MQTIQLSSKERPNLTLEYTGEVNKEGMPNGQGTLIAPGWYTYQGSFLNGTPEGNGTYKFANGELSGIFHGNKFENARWKEPNGAVHDVIMGKDGAIQDKASAMDRGDSASSHDYGRFEIPSGTKTDEDTSDHVFINGVDKGRVDEKPTVSMRPKSD